MSMDCTTCDGYCVCAEVEKAMEQIENLQVNYAVRMTPDRMSFELGGDLETGDKIVNIIVHPPEWDGEDMASTCVLGFSKEAVRCVIDAFIGAYEQVWVDRDE